MRVQAFAPGRVNLIGDHTDYTGGLALPMAIQLGTTIELERGGDTIQLRSENEPTVAEVRLPVDNPAHYATSWAAYPAGVAAVIKPSNGGTGTVASTLPIGAGLSSSASLEVALALALGFDGDALSLALACQQAERVATGVPCGVMDQYASALGRAGHALLLDCRTLEATHVPIPDEVEVVAVHCGQPRKLSGSAYGDRASACTRSESIIGPLRDADRASLDALNDDDLRRISRHVISENQRVTDFAHAMTRGDYVSAGQAMNASHDSLATDYAVSTPTLDALAARLQSTPGVFGARMTGAGFGGCVVALAAPGALNEGWTLQAVDGARVE